MRRPCLLEQTEHVAGTQSLTKSDEEDNTVEMGPAFGDQRKEDTRMQFGQS